MYILKLAGDPKTNLENVFDILKVLECIKSVFLCLIE